MSLSESASTPTNTPNITIITSPEHNKFLFACEHLNNICTLFGQCDMIDQTDTILQVKLDDLEHRWVLVQESFKNIMLSLISENVKDIKESIKTNFNVTSEAYYTAKSQILDILKISETNMQKNTTQNKNSDQVSLNIYKSSLESSDIYLNVPPCDTEIFSGSYEEWPSFRDMFTAVYSDHPQLSQAQKLYYLRSKTSGEAGAIVNRYSLCDDNFQLAWNSLKSRYENKRVLVDKQLNILFNIPVATKENSESIYNIHTAVKDCLSTLHTLNIDIASWDPILIHLVSTKLPEQTLSLFEQSLKSHRDLPTWSQLDEFLSNRFEVVERIASIRNTKENQAVIPSQNYSKTPKNYSTEKFALECSYCHANHQVRACAEFRKLTAQQRLDVVTKSNICGNCLSSSHNKISCKSTNTCLICHKTHHTLLHPNNDMLNSVKYDANKNRQSYSSQIESSTIPVSSQIENYAIPVSSQIQANFSTASNSILLRTALVQVQNNDRLHTVRALIDSGSQRTFITQTCANRLNLSSKNTDSFEITGVGGQKQVSKAECQLSIVSNKHNIKFYVSAIILPLVTKPLPAISIKISDHNSLKDLGLADPRFYESSEIDIILGADVERFINLDGIKKNVFGNTSAYNTIFGWVLSGPIFAENSLSSTTNFIASNFVSIAQNKKRKRKNSSQKTSKSTKKCSCIKSGYQFCDTFNTSVTKSPSNAQSSTIIRTNSFDTCSKNFRNSLGGED
ncbi:sulfotransferase 4 isoform X1 [Musca autumnalis]|uniref:sulfotransferase 4 isoform X1 n=1 Tax=Musca autumnalis TaxID=221902 RepID=UPI003CFB68C8